MRVLLADDHDLVRDALKSLIERQAPDAEVATAASFTEAAAILERWSALDIVVLDFNMPGMNGWEGLHRAKALRAGIPVVILSGVPEADLASRALAEGASGFVPKTLAGSALVSALRLVLAGEPFAPVAATYAKPLPATAKSAEVVPFTARERQVLQHLIKGHSNKEIAQQLEVEEVTIKLHLRGLFRKLGARNRTQVVTQALQRGLA